MDFIRLLFSILNYKGTHLCILQKSIKLSLLLIILLCFYINMTECKVLIIKYCLYSAVNIYDFTELKISNGIFPNELTVIKFLVEFTYEI